MNKLSLLTLKRINTWIPLSSVARFNYFVKPIAYQQSKICEEMQSRLSSTQAIEKPNIFKRIKTSLNNMYSEKKKMEISALLIYEKTVDNMDFGAFFQNFNMPDTFQSWFQVISLHVWMAILVAMSDSGGKFFRSSIVESMWNDVELRIGQLNKNTYMMSSEKKRCLKEMVAQFKGLLISFDEGIHKDDTVLAAAAWRTIYAFNYVDPEVMEKLVMYIRQQIDHLERQNMDNIMLRGELSFLPLNNFFPSNT